MRVLLTLSSGRIGGAEQHVRWLAGCLRDLPGMEVAVACREGAIAERLREEGVPVHTMAFSDGIDLLTPLRLAHRARHFDLMHAHMNRASLYTRLAASLSGVPWVTTAHGMTRGSYYRGSSRVIAVSEGVRRHLEAQGVEPVVVVPNALPELDEPTEEDRRELARALPEDPRGDRVLALVLANLHPNKGQDLVVEALAHLPERYHLLLAGAGEIPRIQELFRQHPGLEARVHRVGILSSAAAPFEVADVVLVPSKREAFSLVAAEARIRGVPVLASDVDGLSEVVCDGAPGCLRVRGRDPVRWAGALEEMGEHLERYRTRARSGSAAARDRFDLDTLVRATRAIYRSVLLPGPHLRS